MKHYNLKRMIMKKSIILLAMVLGAFTAKAQSVVEGTKFADNWSVEVNAGAITPLTHSAFFKNARPAFGVGLSKQLTPVFGLGFQGMGYINTTPSKTAFDASDVSLLGKVNLMNLFAGYNGTPRLFEVVPLATLLCRRLGADGVWHAFWITEVLAAAVSGIVYRRAVTHKK